MTLPVSSRMASVLSRTQHQRELCGVAAKAASAAQFSSLTHRTVWLEGNSDSSERDIAWPRLQVTMNAFQSDKSARPYGTSSSSEDSSEYYARWRNAVHHSAASPSGGKRNGWSTAASPKLSSSMDEFDPILSIRAVNPLIFENNYDLDEYGPSFRDAADAHDTLIKEWRIRHDNAA